ncbi:MAG: DUF4102 domain-containing protein [Candidatus Riflebacteria bacterium]|nr:DUF4102 domain-containing protein [Candidatus Riflebacteria bacterium]
MALNDLTIRTAKPGSKAFKIFDGGGLFLLITPQGSKYWRWKYRFAGKEKLLALGVYPEVGLKEAREKKDQARKLLAGGVDPAENRKAVKAATLDRASNSFEVLAIEWITKHSKEISADYMEKVESRLRKE